MRTLLINADCLSARSWRLPKLPRRNRVFKFVGWTFVRMCMVNICFAILIYGRDDRKLIFMNRLSWSRITEQMCINTFKMLIRKSILFANNCYKVALLGWILSFVHIDNKITEPNTTRNRSAGEMFNLLFFFSLNLSEYTTLDRSLSSCRRCWHRQLVGSVRCFFLNVSLKCFVYTWYDIYPQACGWWIFFLFVFFSPLRRWCQYIWWALLVVCVFTNHYRMCTV